MNMPNTPTYIFNELRRRNVPVEIIREKANLMRYQVDGTWHLIKGCVIQTAPAISCEICDNKTLAEHFAQQIGFSTPKSVRYEDDGQALEFIKQHEAAVVKPLDAAHGHGISLNVRTITDLKRALRVARVYSKKRPLLQKMVHGEDLRLLMIGGKLIAAVRRVPASVVGDGQHTVKELIELENALPHRVTGKRGELKVISIKAAELFLKKHIHDIPPRGERIAVVGVSNTSMGGHAEDATDDVASDIRERAEAFVQMLGLPVCGIDVMQSKGGKCHFIEANARPGFGPHHHPRAGKKRDVTHVFVDHMLDAARVNK